MNINSEYLMSERGLALLAKLFQSSGEGIMLFNQKGKVVVLNPRAEEIFGYNEDELIGKAVEDLIPSDFRKTHVSNRTKYMKSPSQRSMGQGRDLKGLRKDQSTFPLEISLNYLEHENEMMVVAFITDITIRKNNEKMVSEQRQKLEEYADQLEKKVKARTSELEHLNLGLQSQIQERKLAEKALYKSLQDLKKAEQDILNSLEKERELGELKSRFVSMASHEFRTPLTTILSSANLIGKYAESDQQDSREKHINRINKSVQNLTGILNDFLSLEKLESGLLKVTKNSFDLDELISEVMEDIGLNLKQGQVIDYQKCNIMLDSDEHVLRNILINLLSNASKYSSEQDKILLSVSRTDDALRIAVKDHGIGIPEGEQKSLFGRFFRAGNATNIQGTGLGLNIVRKYIQLLGGEIVFDSEEGKGSVFTVTLPTS